MPASPQQTSGLTNWKTLSFPVNISQIKPGRTRCDLIIKETFFSLFFSLSFEPIQYINFLINVPFSVIEETLVIKVIGEPVLKLNTGILKCQIPNSMKHQVQIVSWKFGNNFVYPTQTWPKGN